MFAASVVAPNAQADIVDDLKAKSEANKSLNDRKRLATSYANFARSRTLADGTCQFPNNFFGCDIPAVSGDVRYITEDATIECQVPNFPALEPNTFEPLQLHNEESLPDVETAEKILYRAATQSPAVIAKDSLNTSLSRASMKFPSFEEGELDDSWTIVASRRTRRNSRQSTPVASSTATDDEAVQGKSNGKPRRWRRSLWALGTAAASCFLGTASRDALNLIKGYYYRLQGLSKVLQFLSGFRHPVVIRFLTCVCCVSVFAVVELSGQNRLRGQFVGRYTDDQQHMTAL